MTALSDLLDSVRAQLRGLRSLRGVSQARLAAVLGRTQSTISHQLSGRYGSMELATIVQMATALDADVEILIKPRGLPSCPLVTYGTERAVYRCPDGLWSAQGPAGEVEADRGTKGRPWALWMGQGGAWGTAVADHVCSCPACSMICEIEYV